ncbi:hypothetical protein M2281_004610 [Mesorhizobium soli]|uniref:hypothetical protein n=1 Tax=Pseudaminobacter soli (ex Li et al. 2025) TaxID=1295366 RepID=UPI0024756A21|nr:hypothetical protein [Mesorhizobium soli]MDH6233997.1 hypothetical protein [Mesorhizobium soli]
MSGCADVGVAKAIAPVPLHACCRFSSSSAISYSPSETQRCTQLSVDSISALSLVLGILDGIRDYAFEQGLLVSAHVTQSNPGLEQAVLRAVLRDPSIARVVYATIFTRKVRVPSELKSMPTVLLNCYADPRQHAAIVPGEVAGGFAATAHLTALGHKRIGRYFRPDPPESRCKSKAPAPLGRIRTRRPPSANTRSHSFAKNFCRQETMTEQRPL